MASIDVNDTVGFSIEQVNAEYARSIDRRRLMFNVFLGHVFAGSLLLLAWVFGA
jgi:hypothetical protein